MSDKNNNNNYLLYRLSWYSAYHSVFGNQLIHFIFIPILLITTLILCLYIPYSQLILYKFNNDLLNKYFPINLCLLIWRLMYPLSYIYIDLIGGITWIPMSIFVWFTTNYFYAICQFETILIIFIISWIAQFLSHGLLEQRRPALIDSLYSSIVLAPFFWHFEIFIFPFGFYQNIQSQMIQNAKKIQKEMDQKKSI